MNTLQEWVDAHQGEVGIAFTDVVGSTRLLFDRQTLEFRGIMRQHRNRAEQLVKEFDGYLVEFTGDSTLAVFADAAGACHYALAFHEDSGHEYLGVRCGIHFGPVRTEAERLIGRSVYLTARVRDHGTGPEVWLSDEAKTALEADAPAVAKSLAFSDAEDCELKGIPDLKRLWRVA